MKKQEQTWTDWKEICEFRNVLIEGIMTHLDEPILRDYTIPSVSKLSNFIIDAIYEVCGKKKGADSYHDDYYGCNFQERDVKNPKKLSKKIRDELQDIIRCGKDDHSWLYNYMMNSDFRFDHNYSIGGHDALYRWYPGEREKAIERMNETLTQPQKRDVKKIAIVIKRLLKENGSKN